MRDKNKPLPEISTQDIWDDLPNMVAVPSTTITSRRQNNTLANATNAVT
jgi:hypothetical protein